MTETHRDEPKVSWLELELHALGKLSPERAEAVERGMAGDEETRCCFGMTKEPVALNPLPDLPSARPLRSAADRGAPARSRVARLYWLAPLAAAAALVLFLGRAGEEQAAFPGPRIRVKGGDVAVTLVRNRDAAVTDRPETFAPADRFKVLVTCPPGLEGNWDVVVVQGGELFFPLDPVELAACGNEIPVPGAFALDGEAKAEVCVVRRGPGGGPVERGAALAGRLGEAAACARLRAEPTR